VVLLRRFLNVPDPEIEPITPPRICAQAWRLSQVSDNQDRSIGRLQIRNPDSIPWEEFLDQ